MRRALQRLLRAAGFQVQVYASGSEFMKHASASEQDCLVLDLHMPDMTGFDVQDALFASRIDIPVVVLTGHDTPGSRVRALENGARSYLCKPVDEDVLISAIASAIGGAGANANQ
ncbi:response regulator [Lysobacter niastensis]|uniref:Response regulator n=1 Tax=Lysobacter niastensis TaxID=380629 RepID=A0ABS0B506_9GAMM|nr:response regulator [Lysobacter niastensis]